MADATAAEEKLPENGERLPLPPPESSGAVCALVLWPPQKQLLCVDTFSLPAENEALAEKVLTQKTDIALRKILAQYMALCQVDEGDDA